MENRMALDLFIGICGALCLIVGGSILLGKLVMWIQEQLRLRKEEKELGRIVQQQKRWENLEKELAKLDNSSAIDMALDPKPWGHLPVSEQKYVMNCLNCGEVRHFAPYNGPGAADRACTECGLGLWTKEAQERGMKPMDIMPSAPNPWTADPIAKTASGETMSQDYIQEAPHTMWCPRCGSHKKYLAHAAGGIPHHKCEDCGQRYRQSHTQNQVVNRYDRNAVPTDTPSPSSSDLEGHWPSIVIFEEPEPQRGGWNDTYDEPVTFGGGDFGGSGAGDSYDSSSDSDSSSDFTTSND